MTTASIQTPTHSVKTPHHLRRITCAGHAYYESVERLCGHVDYVPTDDNRADCTAAEWASRADVLCADCRRQRDAQRPTVPTLIGKPYGESRGGSGGGHGSKRPTEHKNRRPRTTRRDQAIAAAWQLYNGADKFLTEAADGRYDSAPHVIALARRFRAQGLRQLRALGVVL